MHGQSMLQHPERKAADLGESCSAVRAKTNDIRLQTIRVMAENVATVAEHSPIVKKWAGRIVELVDEIRNG